MQVWREKHNRGLMDKFKKPNTVNEIKRNKLEWASYARRKRYSMIQRVLQENPRSKRPLGSPRLRWENGIRKDFLNVTGENFGRPGLEKDSGE